MSSTSSTKRVMIVDDHAAVRRLVSSLFRAQGFDVFHAEHGAEAIERAQELKPQFIVLDLSMPIMNGLEAARALQILMPHVPLVMFTNHEGPAMEKEARAAGISAVVSKSESAGAGEGPGWSLSVGRNYSRGKYAPRSGWGQEVLVSILN